MIPEMNRSMGTYRFITCQNCLLMSLVICAFHDTDAPTKDRKFTQGNTNDRCDKDINVFYRQTCESYCLYLAPSMIPSVTTFTSYAPPVFPSSPVNLRPCTSIAPSHWPSQLCYDSLFQFMYDAYNQLGVTLYFEDILAYPYMCNIAHICRLCHYICDSFRYSDSILEARYSI